MKKYIKHIVFILFMMAISIYTYYNYNYNSKSYYDENYSKSFIKAVDYIKNEDYSKSYETIKDSSKKEKELVQTILLYKLVDEIDSYTVVKKKIREEAENITDYLTYTYLYDRDTKYQKNIDKIYENEYNKLFDVKSKLPKEIMFEDTQDLYDKYLELLELDKDTFKNLEYKIIKTNSKLVKTLKDVSAKITEIINLEEEAMGRYPSSTIPEEYMYLLNLK